MTPEKKKALQDAIESLRPEAKEFTESVMSDKMKTTKDNYGKVMAFLGTFQKPIFGQLFLLAMMKEGYPSDTGKQIMELMGW